MVPASLEPGAVLPLVREVIGSPDPLALYRLLSDGGRRAGTFLLESAETGGDTGQRSILGVGSALRITCVDRTVFVDSLSPNGASMLPWIAERLNSLGDRDGPGWSSSPRVALSAGSVRVDFPSPMEVDRDEAARVRLPSPLDTLRTIVFGAHLLARPTDCCHLAAGIFSYDLVELFETLPAGVPEEVATPHFEFVVPDRLVIVDHQRHRTLLVANAYGGAGADSNYHDAVSGIRDLLKAVHGAYEEHATKGDRRNGREAQEHQGNALPPVQPDVAVDVTDAEYAELVLRLKRRIVAGDVFQIVASRTFRTACPNPLAAYGELRKANPSPYLFYVASKDSVVFGASPETAVKVKGAPRRVTIRPIAGTAQRGRNALGTIDPDLDARREAALRLDEKEMAEHMMLVDLARNDVARVSRPGTRQVTRLLTVDRYAHVMHLVSEVEGVLADDTDALHAYTAAMNMGTLVGAPKIRAAQILRDVEATRRGAYGGAVGYIDGDGGMDTAIVIRAAVVRGGTASVRAGAGIVFDSDPVSEAQETRRKAEAVLQAIAAARVSDD